MSQTFTQMSRRRASSHNGKTRITESAFQQSPDTGAIGYLRRNGTEYIVKPLLDSDDYEVVEYQDGIEVDSTQLDYDDVMALIRRFGDRTRLVNSAHSEDSYISDE